MNIRPLSSRRARARALEEAVRQLYACIIAHGIGGVDDEGAPYEVGAYITDRAARCAARQAVYGTS